jgi:tRNA(Ile)-lysidine synthase
LINLLRGTGMAGLAAMRIDETIALDALGPPVELPEIYVQVQPVLEPKMIRVARPLLSTPRATTRAYCDQVGLTLVEDPSNQSRMYTRNRVRLDLLPVLEGFNPAIRSVLARTADLAGEDVAVLDALVDALHAKLARAPQPDVVEYDLPLWRAQPRALQRRLLRRGVEVLVGGLVDVRAAPIDDALDLLQSGSPAQTYHLPYGIELCVLSDTFILRLHGRARPRQRQKTWDAEGPRV